MFFYIIFEEKWVLITYVIEIHFLLRTWKQTWSGKYRISCPPNPTSDPLIPPLCLVGPGGGDWAPIADRACLLFDCSVSAPYNSDSGIGQDSELFDYSDTMEFSQEWVPTAGGLSVCMCLCQEWSCFVSSISLRRLGGQLIINWIYLRIVYRIFLAINCDLVKEKIHIY